MYVIQDNYETMFNGCIKGGMDFLARNPGIKSFIVGLSGGVDSTVVAALGRRIADLSGIKLIGRSMPIVSNKKEEIDRARLCGAFCDEFDTQDMSEVWKFIAATLELEAIGKITSGEALTFEEKVRLGNIKARLRMTNLYNLAAKNHGVVLSTDNYTELLMGFWTLHGDVGDFGLIQELFKTEVYGLAAWMADNIYDSTCSKNSVLYDVCVAKPTDGLGITNSDLDQLLPGIEYPTWSDGYAMVDEIISGWIAGTSTISPDHPVIQRYKATHFKRENPISLKRDFILWSHNHTE